MTLSLDQGTALCRLLADPSRCRLLLLLESFELTVAELTQITGLTQSRISTHLARLRRAGLVDHRRAGSSAIYALADIETDEPASALWQLLRDSLDDVQTRVDLERAERVISARKHGQTWAESVAGRMELSYSPGRTWEATARALIGLFHAGDVLDIAAGDGVLTELLAAQARSVTCIDISPAVIAAARRRLSRYANVRVERADMHALPFADRAFDHVFAMHALTHTVEPGRVIGEATRVLRPGGRLIVAALKRHTHAETMRAYDHVNQGIDAPSLHALLVNAGLEVERLEVSSREHRPPYFEVLGAQARRPQTNEGARADAPRLAG